MRLLLWLFAVLYLFISLPLSLRAQIPAFIPIYGSLVDSDGKAIDGVHNLRFDLFNNDSGSGTALYTENHLDVPVDNGHFIVYLGNGVGGNLDLGLFRDNAEIWLQVTVDSTDTLAPLIRLATVPYAAYAQQCVDAQTLGGNDPSAYAPISDGLSALGSGCGESGYVPQWDNNEKRWICSKISTDTAFTGQDAVNAVASAGFIRDTDVESMARAVCYDDSDPAEIIPAAKVDLAGYATTSSVNSQLGNYATQTSVNNAIGSALNDYYTKNEIDKKTSSIPWSSLTGVPTGLSDGDDDTTYGAKNGGGLSLYNREFSVDMATVASSFKVRRIPYGSAEQGTFIRDANHIEQIGDHLRFFIYTGGTPVCNDSNRGTMRMLTEGTDAWDSVCYCLKTQTGANFKWLCMSWRS